MPKDEGCSSSSFPATGGSSLPPFDEKKEEESLNIWYAEEGASIGWVEPLTYCDHLGSLCSDLVHIPTSETPCSRYCFIRIKYGSLIIMQVWLGKTLQKLDSLLVQVCQEFEEDKYITVIDAYALIGGISGLAEKIQSFFMQNVLSETHYILKTVVHDEDEYSDDSQTSPSSRMTFSDLCPRIPEPMFRICLIRTLSVLFKIMSSYHSIMICETQKKIYCSLTTSDNPPASNGSVYLDSEESLLLKSECPPNE